MINIIGICLRLLGLLIYGLGVLPRVHLESKVPNGLGFLRRMILLGMGIYFLTHIAFFTASIIRFVNHTINQDLDIISLVNSASFLLVSVVFYLIYSRDYGRLK